ncbi:MAG: YfiR family protein [Vicingaceae bacterium]
MKALFKIGLILMCFFQVAFSSNCSAQKFSKYEIKAAYIQNFIRFVQWPEEKNHLILGVIGENEFTDVLKLKLINQKVGKNSLKIIHYSEMDESKNCDILYVAKDESVNCKKVLEQIKDKAILTIGESQKFFSSGGIINLSEQLNGNYIFQINNTDALAKKIIISSKLLTLAAQVK